MCEKFCGIWANIAAQIASEAPRIRAHRLACKLKDPYRCIWGATCSQAGYHPRKRIFKTHPKHVFFRCENRP